MRAYAWAALAVAAGAAAGAWAAASHPGPPEGALLASEIAGGAPSLGDPGAPVVIVEWGDYQCTHCHRFHRDTLGEIVEAYVEPGAARLVFRDFVLNGPDSALAAEASHCAGDQGGFWGYHDALYENWGGERTGWVTRGSLLGFAEGLGLDAGRFEACMDAGEHAGRVRAERAGAEAAGVDATPTFLVIDGESAVLIRGNQPARAFHDAVAHLASLPGSGQT